MGIRWGYVFLRAASYIPEEEVKGLMVQAVEMYLQGEVERNIKSSSFEGKLHTEQKYELLGEFGGSGLTPSWRLSTDGTKPPSW